MDIIVHGYKLMETEYQWELSLVVSQKVHHETLYIGRAEHNGHLIPGKVAPSHKVCYISFVGKEIAKNSYEILIDSNVTVDPTT